MKALIILDLDDNWMEINKFTLDKLFADITLYEKKALDYGQCDYLRRVYRCFDGRLKPLPHKDFIDEAESYQTEEEYKAYVCGWNECLDEILGDEHE